MYASNNQTPISFLQEYCVKQNITAHFELISNEGQVHEPIYVFQCTAGNVSVVGKGPSKKKAKHQASYLILLKLIGTNPATQREKKLLRDVQSSAAATLRLDYGDMGNTLPPVARTPENFVNKLQEHCDKHMWPPPTYEFVECLPSLYNGLKFQCKVKLWKWECPGFGISKKEAKRKAASELLKAIIEKQLRIPSEDLEAMEEENLPLVEKNDLSTLKDKHTIEEKAARSTKQLLAGVFNGRGKLPRIVISDLADTHLDIYATLGCILEKHNLKVFYSYINVTKSGKIYCQAQLSTVPPQVLCSLPSTSVEEARQNVAYRCLAYLEVMTMPAPCCNANNWFRSIPTTVHLSNQPITSLST